MVERKLLLLPILNFLVCNFVTHLLLALEPEASYFLQFKGGEQNIEHIFVVASGKYQKDQSCSLIILDPITKQELVSLDIMEPSETLDGTIRRFVAFKLSKNNNQWDVTPVQIFSKDSSEESFAAFLRESYLDEAVKARPFPKILDKPQDTEIDYLKIQEVCIGATVKGKKNLINLKSMLYDITNTYCTDVNSQQKSVSANIQADTDDKKVVVQHYTNENMPILGETNDAQIRIALTSKQHKYRHIVFGAEIDNPASLQPTDVIVVRVYELGTIKEILRYEIPVEKNTKFTIGYLTRNLSNRNAYFFNNSVVKGLFPPNDPHKYLPPCPTEVVVRSMYFYW